MKNSLQTILCNREWQFKCRVLYFADDLEKKTEELGFINVQVIHQIFHRHSSHKPEHL